MERKIQKTQQDLILILSLSDRGPNLEIVVVADLESHQTTNFGSSSPSAPGPEEIIIEQDIFSVLVFWTKT